MNTPSKNWWTKIRWDGCLFHVYGAPNFTRPPLESTGGIPGESLPLPQEWFNEAIPTINQHGPSCCGQAWANWLEMMLRRYHPEGRGVLKEGEQLDGYAIWKHGRKMFYDGIETGGLYLPQGFHALMDLGMLPPGTALFSISTDRNAIFKALAATPLVQGTIVGRDMDFPNPENGQIDESIIPSIRVDGAHATVIMAGLIQNEEPFLCAQNSWGSDYGWDGYFTMTMDHWYSVWIGDGPYTALLPFHWWEWDGWRKYVTREAA